MCQKALRSDEIVDYADAYSKVTATAPGRFNPYKVGVELWRDIEERWDRGMFGSEWESCDSMVERERWDRSAGLGRGKIFEVRKLYNDVTFIDAFLTEDFVERQRLYTFGYNPKVRAWEISSREFGEIKQKLLDSLTNFGHPFNEVRDGNFRNRSELLLKHIPSGAGLKMDHVNDVLVNLHRVWKRPVHIETQVDGRHRLVGFDGKQHHNESWER